MLLGLPTLMSGIPVGNTTSVTVGFDDTGTVGNSDGIWGYHNTAAFGYSLGSISGEPVPGQTVAFIFDSDESPDTDSLIGFFGDVAAELAPYNRIRVNGVVKGIYPAWGYNGLHTVWYTGTYNFFGMVGATSSSIQLFGA